MVAGRVPGPPTTAMAQHIVLGASTQFLAGASSAVNPHC